MIDQIQVLEELEAVECVQECILVLPQKKGLHHLWSQKSVMLDWQKP